jgi:hypothetical protein
MPRAEQLLILRAAGYFSTADGLHVLNHCGKSANPGVKMIDLNKDGIEEAMLADAGDCFKDGKHFAIIYKQPNGLWQGMISEDGSVAPAGTRTAGWPDLLVTVAGNTRRFAYATTSNVGYYSQVAAAAKPPSGVAPVAAASGVLNPATKPAAVSPAVKAALFKAAGATRRGAKWVICTDDPDAEGVGIDSVQDLNGDGRAEVVVTEGGSYCYGNTGAGFVLLSQQADGSWKRLAGETGMATFLKTRGVGGWPDLEVGGPGFCYPVSRWNGKEYAFLQFNEYQRGICAANGLKPAVRAY